MSQTIQVKVGESFADMEMQQTQTNVRPGWKIVDIQLKSTCTRYLWGGQSHQLTEDGFPAFRIEPGKNETLVQYAIIRLKTRNSYRALKKPLLTDNDYLRLEPTNFDIHADKEDGFIVSPRKEFSKGEYILVNLDQKPSSESGDYNVFPFQVP